MKKVILIFTVISILSQSIVYAEANSSINLNPVEDGKGAKKKFWLLNGALAGVIISYGAINWWKDTNHSISFTDEGWFASYATNGGADKFGHAFTAYTLSRILNALYREIGIREDEARWQGPVVGLSLMTLVEVGDAFSHHGFSTSDLVADSAGVFLAYLEESYPTIDDLIDFRIEYLPTKGFLRSGKTGFDTDYSGMKHLIVFKLSGIKGLRDSPLSYLEFHAGYFTRGYSVYDEGYYDEQTRNIYTAVSINLSRLLESASNRAENLKKPLHITSRFLEYYQIPGLYIDHVETLRQ